MSEREKKRLCPFSFVKANTKERKKAFSCESAAGPASLSGKDSFYNQGEWL